MTNTTRRPRVPVRLLLTLIGMLSSATALAAGSARMYTPELLAAPGQLIDIPISIANSTPIVAAQFTVEYPSSWGFFTTKIDAARKSDHIIASNRLENGKVLILLYSPTNSPLSGNDGAVAYIQILAPEGTPKGETFNIAISDATAVEVSGGNILNDVSTGLITIGDATDFTVSDVTLGSQHLDPGASVDLQWTVGNSGDIPSTSGWKENIYITDNNGHETLIATTRNESVIGARASVMRATTVTLPAILGVGDEGSVLVRLIPFNSSDESAASRGNNEASSTTVTVGKRLSLQLSANTVAENASTPVYGKLTRSGSWLAAETFELSCGGFPRLDMPQSLTIPAGASQASFQIMPVDNQQLDAELTATITAGGNGYQPSSQILTVTDNDKAALTLTLDRDELTEGESAILTVSTNRVADTPVTVYLTCPDKRHLDFPAQVTIPAGENSVQVTVSSKDDDIPSSTVLATIKATAQQHDSDTADLTINDDDTPQIDFALSTDKVSEGAGYNAIKALISRSTLTDKRVTVRLIPDIPGILILDPSTITLEKGVKDAEFTIGVVDNATVDGDRTVQLTAAVYASICSCTVGAESGGSITRSITVIDNDGPALSLSSSSANVREGQQFTLTVARNTTDNNAPLTVYLSADDGSAGRLAMPSTLTIPAGETSYTATVEALSNNVDGDSHTVTLTARADNYAQGVCHVGLTDQTLPDAIVTSIEFVDTPLYAGSRSRLRVTVANEGIVPLNAPQTRIMADGVTIATLMSPVNVAPGTSTILEGSAMLPATAGNVTVTATVTPGDNAKELSSANNTLATAVTLSPSFTANVTPDKATYLQGETVALSGKATGSGATNSPVEIYAIVDGTRSVINATTGTDGTFSASFVPQAGMSGHYSIGACYPGENANESQAAFDVRGLRLSGVTSRHHSLVTGVPTDLEFTVTAPGDLTETEIRAEVISAPEYLNVTFSCPTQADNMPRPMSVTLSADTPSPSRSEELFAIRLTSESGAYAEYSGYIHARAATGVLTSDINNISTTMTPGTVREYPLTITNTGAGETGTLTVSLPDADWMKLATPRTMGSLASGESATVMLTLAPTDGMQLNVPRTGAIAINAANANALTLPFSIEPVSDTTGRLGIEVCDEYTYYTAEAPKVKGATVTVRHPVRKTVITTVTTGDDGRARLELPAGYYTIDITEPNHESFSGNMMVDAGKETIKTVNLSFSAIKVDWSVEETEVKDEYRIETTLKYETGVPMPVVITTLPDMSAAASLDPGESMIFNAVLTNKGLITAHESDLLMEPTDGVLYYESLNPGPYEIAANQSVTVPIKVSRPAVSRLRATGDHDGGGKPLSPQDTIQGNCGYGVFTVYAWDCGLDRKWHRYKKNIKVWVCMPTSSPGLPLIPGSSDGGGEVYYPDFNYGGSFLDKSVVSNYLDEECTPCQNSRATKAFAPCIKTLLRLIPYSRPFMEAYDAVTGAYDDINGKFETANKAYEMLEKAQKFFEFCRDNNLNPADMASWSDDQTQKYNNYLNKELNGLSKELIDDLMGDLIDLIKEQLPDWVSDAWDCTMAMVEKCNAENVGWGWEQDDPVHTPRKTTRSNELLPDGDDVVPSVDGNNTVIWTPDIYPFGGSTGGSIMISTLPRAVTESMFSNDEQRLLAMMGHISTFYIMVNRLLDWTYCGNEWGTLTPENATTFSNGYRQLDANDETAVGKFREETRDFLSDEHFESIIARRRLLMPSDDDIQTLRSRRPRAVKTAQDTIDNLLLTRLVGDMASMFIAYDEMTDHGKRSLTEYSDMAAELDRTLEEEAQRKSVCASITLQLSQSMVMTRQAFEGTLTVYNGNESKSMTDARLSLEITDTGGNIATPHEMQTTVSGLDGFTGPATLDGGWKLAPKQTGVAKMTFIPTRYAAPDSTVTYSFAGSLSYLDPFSGTTVTRTLSPVSLAVKPSPVLDMRYFMQRDVIADDPMTQDIVEPREPAEFSLLLTNVGKGDATDINLITEQPRIIENEKGLLIDFDLLSSQLNGKGHTLALGSNVATAVGDIPAGSSAYAQWWMESSLMGHFSEYNVEATHLSSYGNPDLSLLGNVSIHELIRSLVTDNADGEPMARAFLVNDETDANDTPDMVYLSDGSSSPVALAEAVNVTEIDDSHWHVTLNAAAGGWVYGSTPDITAGRREILSVTRDSDSKPVDPRNIWITYVTMRDGQDPLYEYRLHVADNIPSANESYTVTLASRPDTELAVVSISGMPDEAAVAKKPVSTLIVKFNKPIIPETFSTADMTLSRQGDMMDTAGATVTQLDETSYAIGLGELTAGNGYYLLTVNTSAIYDRDNFTGRDGKSAGWTQYRDGMVNYTTSATPALGGTVTPSGATTHGNTMTLTATPADGYTFAGWYIDGASSPASTETSISHVMLGDTRFDAHFAECTYLVTAGCANYHGYIDNETNGTFAHGTQLQFTASPDDPDEYRLARWTVNGESYSTEPTITVSVDRHMDIRAEFEAIPSVSTRYLLPQGWNWITIAHYNDEKDIATMLPSIHRGIMEMTGADGSVSRDSEGNLTGSFSTLVPGDTYRVRMDSGYAVTIKGRPIDNHRTAVAAGWNRLSFVSAIQMPLSAVIADAKEGEVIKGIDAFAVFDGYEWHGTLSSLTPGQGYMFKASGPREIIQSSYGGALGEAKTTSDATKANSTPWKANAHAYPDNMPMIARAVSPAKADIDPASIILAAFVGEQCRGIATVDADNNLQYLTVHGSAAGEQISFMAFDTANDTEMTADTRLPFTTDIAGSLSAPVEVRISDTTGLHAIEASRAVGIYPNPAVERFYVSGEGATRVTVYSESGAVVADTADIDGGIDISHLPSGAYIVTVKTADGACSHKLLKVNR